MYLSFRRRRNHIIRVSVFPSSLKPSSFTSYWRSCLYLSFRRRRNHIIPVSIFPSSLKPFSFTSYRQTCICHSDAVWITFRIDWLHLSFRRRRNHIMQVSVFPSSLKPSCFTSYRKHVFVIPTQEESHHASISVPFFTKTILLHNRCGHACICHSDAGGITSYQYQSSRHH